MTSRKLKGNPMIASMLRYPVGLKTAVFCLSALSALALQSEAQGMVESGLITSQQAGATAGAVRGTTKSNPFGAIAEAMSDGASNGGSGVASATGPAEASAFSAPDNGVLLAPVKRWDLKKMLGVAATPITRDYTGVYLLSSNGVELLDARPRVFLPHRVANRVLRR
jgi:hypothetical protein